MSGSDLELKNVLNYPNPFSSGTTFTFWASQNCTAVIKIYTVAGRLLYKFEEFPLQTNELAQIAWDGRDEDGDVLANGVYFYKVIARGSLNGESKTAEEIQKFIIMR